MSMDPENETHPLLHDFENETWRSRTRKRCIRIPSEAAITGLILGVFFVVVTLLIVLENMEKTKKDDISIDKKLLASPGFNQKLIDKSWKDEKLRKLDKVNKDWKILSDQSDSLKYNKKAKGKSWQDEKQRKFDKVNKGWKILPNVTGNRDNRWDDEEDMKDIINPKPISIVADEYGREEDERWSSFFSDERRDPNLRMSLNDEMNEIVTVLQSPMIKREKVNEEWRKLSELGWKDYEIRKALLKVLIEKKNELNLTGDENVQRSPMNPDELWDKINKSWQEKVEEGRAEKGLRRLIHLKHLEDQKKLNDAWKNKVTVLQSPKASAKKEAREDEGWENLSAQGKKEKGNLPLIHSKYAEDQKKINDAWKNKMISDSFGLIYSKYAEDQMKINDAWKNKMSSDSPGLINSNYVEDQMKINDAWKNKISSDSPGLINSKYAEDQEKINDAWKNKMSVLQSPKATAKKEAREDEGWEKLSGQGWKNKDIEEALVNAWKEKNKEENLLMSPANLQSLWEKATDFIKNVVQEKDSKSTDKSGSGTKSYMLSPSNFEALKSIMETSKKYKKDYNKKTFDDSEKPEDDSSLNPSLKDFIDFIIEKIKKQQKDKMDEGNNGSMDVQYSSLNMDDFIQNLVTEAIKDHAKINKDMMEKQLAINEAWKNKMKNSETTKTSDGKWKTINNHWKTLLEHERDNSFGKNDGSRTLTTTDGDERKILMSSGKMQWKNVENGYKKLSTNGWNDKDIKDAVNKASRDGEKLLQTAMGTFNMKWKKVNDGYKKTYNKSLGDFTSCPLSRVHKSLYLLAATPSPSIDCALISEEVRRKFGQCVDESFLPRQCKPNWRTKCFTTDKYRKIDGTCNNRIHPTWGKSNIPFVRMIAPDYEDGVSEIRKADDGGELPNARFISTNLYSKKRRPDGYSTTLFLYFGLVVDHDMIQTALNSNGISCCKLETDDLETSDSSIPKECLQIDISSDDPFYGPKNVTCLNLVRSFPVNGECGGRREQQNQATSYLDGSAVYGSNYEHAKHLRTFRRGQLRTQLINNKPFMSNADGPSTCGTESEPLKCFDAGDSRVNMLVELTAMHAVWYREHNRIAFELHKINPNWTDEILYQEAKRIVVAEIQHITYDEFLPQLLGEKALERYNLKIDKSKVYDMYDDTVDATVFNVVGAVAFRFGHSLIPDSQYLIGPKNSSFEEVPLHETFFSANLLYHNGLDLLLRGAATQRTQRADSYITPEIREHLFQPSNLDYGFDLAAVGIQRGRDHGIPPYVQWRKACRLSEIKSWHDLYDVIGAEKADLFKKVYRSVEDIDLITGALSEKPREGSLLGPTHTCLLGRQFKKTRSGDRFWYEIQDEIGSFTKGQLEQIYKSNMARIICDNSDNIDEIQKNPFKVPSNDNPLSNCADMERVDLSEWSSED